MPCCEPVRKRIGKRSPCASPTDLAGLLRRRGHLRIRRPRGVTCASGCRAGPIADPPAARGHLRIRPPGGANCASATAVSGTPTDPAPLPDAELTPQSAADAMPRACSPALAMARDAADRTHPQHHAGSLAHPPAGRGQLRIRNSRFRCRTDPAPQSDGISTPHRAHPAPQPDGISTPHRAHPPAPAPAPQAQSAPQATPAPTSCAQLHVEAGDHLRRHATPQQRLDVAEGRIGETSRLVAHRPGDVRGQGDVRQCAQR